MEPFGSIASSAASRLLRQRSFWVIQALLLIQIPLAGFGPPIPGALPLLYLAIPFLAGTALLEAVRQPGEIAQDGAAGLVVRRVGVLAGLWLGLLLGSLVQLAGWFLAGELASSAGWYVPDTYAFWIWPASLAFLLLANTVGLSIAFLLAVLVRRIRPSPLLPIWVVLWFLVFMDVILVPALGDGGAPMQGMVYNNIFFSSLKLSPSLGLGLSRQRVPGMGAWFLGLGLLAAGLGLALSLLAGWRRSVRRSLVLLALVLAGGLAAAGGYALNTRAAAATAAPVSPYDPQIDLWRVERRQADVAVNAATGEISGTSRLTLAPVRPPEKPELVLRLNPGLALATAQDGSGAALSARRLGDSLVVSLPAVPTGPVELVLAWQGRLQISYLSFEQRWKFSDGPGDVPYLFAPLPLKALVSSQGGFLLRDGDWMPWPWTTRPHQAAQGSLTIRPAGGEAAAARPLQDGAAAWEGELPKALLAFLPARQTSLGGSTLAVAPLAGSQHTARAGLFAGAAQQLAPLLGEPAPCYVVAAPYLSELAWSGDLLLLPDGSGAYLSHQLSWSYRYDAEGPARPRLERTALYLLARAWLHDRFAQGPLPFKPRLSPPGEGQVVSMTVTGEDLWYREGGQWVQYPEVADITTNYTPRASFQLNSPGRQSALAFWLALELADEGTRQADLELLAFFADVGQQLGGYSERYERINALLWPETLYAADARELVWDLHEWAARVGPEEAVPLAIEVVRGSSRWDLNPILAELEARSGVPIGAGR